MTAHGKTPPPPKTFHDFAQQFPGIAKAWDLLADAGASGPLDKKTQRLVKLAVSVGTRSEGATHSAVRKALSEGVTTEELYQVIALAASNLGLPQAVAAYTWVREEIEGRK